MGDDLSRKAVTSEVGKRGLGHQSPISRWCKQAVKATPPSCGQNSFPAGPGSPFAGVSKTASRSAFSSSFRSSMRAATAADFRARRSRQQPSQGGSARIKSSKQSDTGGEGGINFVDVTAICQRPARHVRRPCHCWNLHFGDRVHASQYRSNVRFRLSISIQTAQHVRNVKCPIILHYRTLLTRVLSFGR